MKKVIAAIMVLTLLITAGGVVLADTDTNDDFDNAEQVGEGTFSGTVSSGLSTDDDYYKISVPAEKSVLVTVTSGSDADISLTLYDGNRVEQDSVASTKGEMNYLFYDGKSSTSYTVYLYFSGDGDYTFTVEFRPSDMMSGATSVSSGETVNGNIKVGGEVHWYKISLKDGEGMNLTGTATGDGVWIDLYDSGGDELDTNYWNNLQNSFTLAYSTENAQDVYIKIYPVDSGYIDITYSFSIEVDSVPSAPRNLQAVAGNGTVALSWDPPSDDGGAPILYYNIYREDKQGWGWLESTSNNTYMDTLVTNGEGYNYIVRAVNWVGESDASNKVRAIPKTTPSPPYDVVVLDGDGYVEITWEEPYDGGAKITGYKIYRGTVSGGEVFLYSVEATNTTYNDTTVENGKIYYYYVTALNEVGESSPSEERSASPMGPPEHPSNLQITVEKDSVKLTWSAPKNNGGSPIIGYKIYRGTSPNNMECIATVDASTTTYEDADIKPGETYYYKVTALNSEGESSVGASSSASVPSESSGNLTVWIAVAITVLALIGLSVFWMKKKSRTEPPEEK